MNRFDYGCAAVIAACAIGIGCIFAAEPPPVPLRPAPADPQPPAWLNPSPLWVDNPSNAGWYIQKPPARFMPGPGVKIVVTVLPEEVASYCGSARALGCAYPVGSLPGVNLPLQVLPTNDCLAIKLSHREQLECHEDGHSFMGWKHEVA